MLKDFLLYIYLDKDTFNILSSMYFILLYIMQTYKKMFNIVVKIMAKRI